MFCIPFNPVSKALPTFPIMPLKVEENSYFPNKTQEGSMDPSHLSVVYPSYISIECSFVTIQQRKLCKLREELLTYPWIISEKSSKSDLLPTRLVNVSNLKILLLPIT